MKIDDVVQGNQAFLYMERYVDERAKLFCGEVGGCARISAAHQALVVASHKKGAKRVACVFSIRAI